MAAGNLEGVGDEFSNPSLLLVEHGYNPSYGVNFWVRCASGNVLTDRAPHGRGD